MSTAANAGPSSLKRRLVRRLVLLQAAIQLLVIGALVATGHLINFSSPENTVEILQEAVMRGADGRLSMRATPRLAALREAQPPLWFSVRDRQGGRLVEGRIPDEFADIGATLDGVGQARLGWNMGDPPRQSARMRWVDSAAGPVQILTGADSPITWRNLGLSLLLVLLEVVLPILAITVAATLLASHVVVRRTLSGLHAIVARAGQIDAEQRGVRLPLAEVPAEVATLVGAFNDALQRLDDGHARQERFLADAAHELRTPITILQIRLEGLPNDPLKVKLMQASARLATLAEQLLDLQRLDGVVVQAQQVDLKALCERVAADLAPLAIMNRCTLSVDAPQAIVVGGDAPSLERALTNLIQNAIEHGGQGCDIQVRLCEPFCIEVLDSGPGIPESERERVVEPFHRLVPRGRGAGLGLHLVAEVAHLHRGRLTIGSNDAGGARMRLELNLGT